MHRPLKNLRHGEAHNQTVKLPRNNFECRSLHPGEPSFLLQESIQEGFAAQDRSFKVFADDDFESKHTGKRSQKRTDGVPVNDPRAQFDLIVVCPVDVIKVKC